MLPRGQNTWQMADINQYLPDLRSLLLISHVFYSKVDPVDIEKMSSQPTFASLILENKEFSRGDLQPSCGSLLGQYWILWILHLVFSLFSKQSPPIAIMFLFPDLLWVSAKPSSPVCAQVDTSICKLEECSECPSLEEIWSWLKWFKFSVLKGNHKQTGTMLSLSNWIRFCFTSWLIYKLTSRVRVRHVLLYTFTFKVSPFSIKKMLA